MIPDEGTETQGRSILIVDDTPANLKVLVNFLQDSDFKVVISQDGESALHRAEYVNPELILLDVVMPGLNGFEVCQRLKENPKTRDIPVVFMTALSETVDKVKGFKSGAVDYVTKPFQCEEVLARINSHLTIRRLQRQLEEANKTLEERVAERTGELETANTALLTEINKRNRTAEKLKWESEVNLTMAEIATELLSSTHSMRKLSNLTLDNAKKLTNSPHGFVSRIDPKTGDNVSYTLTEMQPGECNLDNKEIRFPIGPDGKYGGLWGHALNSLKSFFTNDPANYPSADGVPEKHIPIFRYLSVPVMVEGKLAAQIALANSTIDYTDKDIKVIEQLGELYGVALQQQKLEKDRETLEKQLGQLQKMEALGTLSGGIAHDFNNLLHPILGYANLGAKKTEETGKLHGFFQAIIIASNRAKELVEQILTFSRQSDQEWKPLILTPIIKEALKFLRSSLPSSIDIKQQIEKESGMVMADPIMIHQIIMNLVTNAFHAMEESGGTIEISLRTVKFNYRDSEDLDLSPGTYAALTVSDTGKGMSPEIQARVFEPYFTTKEKGKGTGLGLSVVLGAVKSHGGNITLSSSAGKGSEFSVYLPQIPSIVKTEAIKPSPPINGNNERILIVDDEIGVVQLEKMVLEELQYQVTICTGSIEALELFRSQPDNFELVITDLMMPDMTGDRLAMQLLKTKPGIPIILRTGYSERFDKEQANTIGIKDFLLKPVTPDQLARSVGDALNKVNKSS